MRRLYSILVLSAGLGLAASVPARPASPVGSALPQATLGANGEVYLARSGTLAALFPKAKDAASDPDRSVLALDILKPGETVERLLVPGTEGTDDEGSPTLLFEESSNTLFLVWETRLSHIYPVLTLAAFDAASEQFTEGIPVLGNPLAVKTAPQLAVTRDTYSLPGSTELRHRTFIHLMWGEENGAGLYQTFYTPIVLENGAFVGHNPIYCLNDLDKTTDTSAAALTAELVHAQRVQPGHDDQTVVATFTSPVTGRVVTIEVDVLSAQLGMLADGARMHIVDIGRRLAFPARQQQIADAVYNYLLENGKAYYPEIVQTIAEQIRTEIQRSTAKGIEQIADAARMHIVDIGAKYSGRGLRNIAGASSQIVEIAGNMPTLALSKPPLTHLIQFRVASSRVAPALPSGSGPVSLFASKDGQDVLAAWSEATRALYRISNGNGWDEAREIRFSDNIDRSKAYEILEQKVKNR
jgi:hypothetical protein